MIVTADKFYNKILRWKTVSLDAKVVSHHLTQLTLKCIINSHGFIHRILKVVPLPTIIKQHPHTIWV